LTPYLTGLKSLIVKISEIREIRGQMTFLNLIH